MIVFHDLESVGKLAARSAVAIGNFDGVHLAHRCLLDSMLKDARAHGLASTVLTFYPHPAEVLRPGHVQERLTTTAEKLAILEGMGVDLVLVAPFNQELAELSAEAFFERYLRQGLRAASVHVGFNFRFGKERKGDTQLLGKLCGESGIALGVLPSVDRDGSKVSSTSIRRLVQSGNVKQARHFMGRPFCLSGQVIRGDARGTQLGFSTANVRYPVDKVLPKHGVYVTRTLWQRQSFASVANLGIRPTFAGQKGPAVLEVHLIDFNARIYDEVVEVQFLDRIRDERKFESQGALIAQIRSDVAFARAYRNEDEPV